RRNLLGVHPTGRGRPSFFGASAAHLSRSPHVMNRFLPFAAVPLLTSSIACSPAARSPSPAPVPTRAAASASLAALPLATALPPTIVRRPPVAPVREARDTYFGTTVVDPYRWMEEPKSGELDAWMRGQADYTRGQLDAIPARASIAARVK